MNEQKYLNNFDTQFVAAVKSAAQTGAPATELDYGILRVSASAGATLGTLSNGDYYRLTAFKRLGSVESAVEVMKVTVVDTSVINETRLTVARGQEGTTPQAYVSGDYVSLRLTRATMEGWLQKSANLSDLLDPAAARLNLGVPGVSVPVKLTAATTLTSGGVYEYTTGYAHTFPPSPSNGDTITLINMGTDITASVSGNGKKIMGSTSTMQLNLPNTIFKFIYVNANAEGDWRMS